MYRRLVPTWSTVWHALLLLTVLLALCASGAPAQLQTYTVTSTDDANDGLCDLAHCSLREAIIAANAAPDGAWVTFSIVGFGPHTIRPTSQLPVVLETVLIDGTSEPDYSGSPVIELDGSLAGLSDGLALAGSDNTIRGLAVNRFQQNGIWIGDEAVGNRVEGCFVGLDLTGQLDRGNTNAGVLIINAWENVVGGSSPAQRNIISGNTEGVTIVGEGASENSVIGNYIGTNVDGNAAVPNGTGILLLSTQNHIGGDDPLERNIISGNTLAGIDLGPPNATINAIRGNYIGTDATGMFAIPNDVGVWVNDVANNTIGSVTAGGRNVISGNREGITLWANATQNSVWGNFIGTNATGTAAIPNENGVGVHGPDNVIGGDTPGSGNLISGNTGEGITIEAVEMGGVIVQGNMIGTDVTGSAALPNGGHGVLIERSPGNAVGGATELAGNLISGNGENGVAIFDFQAAGNLIQGNLIGTDASGGDALPNLTNGILLDEADGNSIGGPGDFERNVISGNGRWGIELVNSDLTSIANNYVGIDASGSSALPNASGGIMIEGKDNIVGGADPAERNVMSGNPSGIATHGSVTERNSILGNYIGTNATGDAAVPNEVGVNLSQGTLTQVGGTSANAGNLISGNTDSGIWLHADATDSFVEGNYVGTDVTGMTVLGNDVGVQIGGSNNRIGGTQPGAGNLISGNGVGIEFTGSDPGGTVIQGNLIGVDATGSGNLGNRAWGVRISRSSGDNLIGGEDPGAGNTIAYNESDGIHLATFAGTGNEIRSNFIFNNGSLGIDLDGTSNVDPNDEGDLDTGPNNLQNYPEVMAVQTGGSVLAKALLHRTLPNEPFTIEFFDNDECGRGSLPGVNDDHYGEGKRPLLVTHITSDASGDASISGTVSGVTRLTATATDGSGNTSEFSRCVRLSDFDMSASPGSRTVTAGGTASYTIELEALVGPFNDAIELECSGNPPGTTCTFLEPELTPGDDTVSTTMTVTTEGLLAAGGTAGGFLAIAMATLVLLGSAKRRPGALKTLLAGGAVVLMFAVGCGDDPTGPTGGTPPGTYELTITGTWETLSHTTEVTLTVN